MIGVADHYDARFECLACGDVLQYETCELNVLLAVRVQFKADHKQRGCLRW